MHSVRVILTTVDIFGDPNEITIRSVNDIEIEDGILTLRKGDKVRAEFSTGNWAYYEVIAG